MGLSVQVRGAFQLGHLARRLREAGRKDLDRQLRKALDRSVQPLTAAVRASVPDYMPDRYAAVLARDLELKSKVSTRGSATGLRIIAHAPTRWDERDVAALERGTLRHPLFGDREWWYVQKIRAGFFSEPIVDGAPLVREQIQVVLADFLNKIARG